MHYLLTIYSDESVSRNASPEDGARMMAAYDAFTNEVKTAGAFVSGNGLQPTSTATTVRVRDGETLLTDGPFAETREQLGGYYLLDCADLDDAVRWAAKIPGAQHGSIEVRPVIDRDAVGSTEHANSGAAQA